MPSDAVITIRINDSKNVRIQRDVICTYPLREHHTPHINMVNLLISMQKVQRTDIKEHIIYHTNVSITDKHLAPLVLMHTRYGTA